MKYWSGVIDLIATRFPRNPVAYLCLFVVWGITLWCLSASNPVPKNGPDIPHLDKVAHFLYFSAGGALLATCGLVLWPVLKRYRGLFFCAVVLIGAVLGRLDEYHQTFTPGRSGNDMGDWAADILGCGAGGIFVIFVILPALIRYDEVQKESEKT
jgi:VanZ family protein